MCRCSDCLITKIIKGGADRQRSLGVWCRHWLICVQNASLYNSRIRSETLPFGKWLHFKTRLQRWACNCRRNRLRRTHENRKAHSWNEIIIIVDGCLKPCIMYISHRQTKLRKSSSANNIVVDFGPETALERLRCSTPRSWLRCFQFNIRLWRINKQEMSRRIQHSSVTVEKQSSLITQSAICKFADSTLVQIPL